MILSLQYAACLQESEQSPPRGGFRVLGHLLFAGILQTASGYDPEFDRG
jgi:hypothetical protein